MHPFPRDFSAVWFRRVDTGSVEFREYIAMRHRSTFFLLAAIVTQTVWAAARQQASDVAPIVFQDRFDSDVLDWDVLGGKAEAGGGRLVIETRDASRNIIAVPRGAPALDVQTLEAVVTVKSRQAPGGWSLAGVAIVADPANLWLLTLTEGPDGRRYIDFLECWRGRWQAQNEGPTQLQRTAADVSDHWRPGVAYRLRLELTDSGIAGRVTDASSGKVLVDRRYEFGDATAVRFGSAAVIARNVNAWWQDFAVRAPAGVAAMPALSGDRAGGWRVAIFSDPVLTSAGTRRAAQTLAQELQKIGCATTVVDADDVSDPRVLNAGRFRALLLPDAAAFPAPAAHVLAMFLRGGGHLIAVGGPPFSEPAWRHNGRWWTRRAIRMALQKVRPVQWVLRFDDMTTLKGWSRSTNAESAPGNLELTDAGAPHGKCLHYRTANLTGWDTWYSPNMPHFIPEGDGLLCFQARADARTPQISIEIKEDDGSRWIAVIEVGTDWRWFVLSEDDFRYWRDSPTGDRRGGGGDHLHFERASVINFGLAQSHTSKVGSGPHEFWIDDLGSAPHPFPGFRPSQPDFPVVETLYPRYKTYLLTRATGMRAAAGSDGAASNAVVPLPKGAFSCIARPRGIGFGNPRKWRWVPLVEAVDSNRERRGTVLWLLLHRTFPYARSCVLGCGLPVEAVAGDEWIRRRLLSAVTRLRQGLFLLQAGTEACTVYEDQEIGIGGEVVNLTGAARAVELAFTVAPQPPASGPVRKTTRTATVQPRHSAEIAGLEPFPVRLAPGKYEVAVELRENGVVVDRMVHDLCVLKVRKPAPKEYVRVSGHRFLRNGRPWNPVGVNYWPLYVSGMEPNDYRSGWLKPAYYDPVEIERDLRLMNELGINMVSIQLNSIECAPNLVDFLRRCGEHDILVNGFLGSASPIAFDEDAVRAELEAARLVDNTVLFAYDIIWEPGNWMFRRDRRPSWNRAWTEWVRERYGSLRNAEEDWGFRAPRAEGGLLAGPTDKQMREDGPWRVMVAAYRRFMDDLMSAKWNAAVRRLRRLDPHHLISFRQGNTLPQDFTFTATPKHIDFICPEGYAIPHSDLGYNAACFITRYVHFTTRGKPILWAEFGRSVWDHRRMAPDPSAYAGQGAYHELFYRVCLDSGANGTAPWWWPGGYRVNERSDFGIIDPDGAPRPAALLVRKYGPKLRADRPWPEPQEWFIIDRDAHPGGYWYVAFHDGAEAWSRARRKGRMLGVRSPGTGTTSANAPLVAVGNRPYNGHNPPKYLNAEFNHLEVLDSRNTWQEAADGAVIQVRAGAPVRIRASVGNTQEATWIAPQAAAGNAQTGTVWLASTDASEVRVRFPVPHDTPYLGDADFGELVLLKRAEKRVQVELQMTALGRAWFGEKRTFTIVPVKP